MKCEIFVDFRSEGRKGNNGMTRQERIPEAKNCWNFQTLFWEQTELQIAFNYN